MSLEEQKNIKLLIFYLTSLQYCYFLSHFYAIIKISEKEKMTDVFKLFRRYVRNVSVKKNGISQRLWIGQSKQKTEAVNRSLRLWIGQSRGCESDNREAFAEAVNRTIETKDLITINEWLVRVCRNSNKIMDGNAKTWSAIIRP